MRCLYLAAQGQLGLVDEAGLDRTTERHKLEFGVGTYPQRNEILPTLQSDEGLGGLIIECDQGYPGRTRLKLASAALHRGYRVWLHWPEEKAVECLDGERISSYWRHWYFIKTYNAWTGAGRKWQTFRRRAGAVLRDTSPRKLPRWLLRRLATRYLQRDASQGDTPGIVYVPAKPPRPTIEQLDELVRSASPIPFPAPAHEPGAATRLPGSGVYLRTDFWAPLKSGGSYGHTCYVAKELAAVCEQFVCFLANHYALLDDYGVKQVVMDHPSATAGEDDIVTATPFYLSILKPAFEALRPSFIYERLCLGNYVGAQLSQLYKIPYIVEYNGSEISMRRSFDGVGYIYEEEYLRAEMFAFQQATMISVVSAEIRNSLVARGVDPRKILVNPNGADLTAYAPAAPDEKAAIRRDIGLSADDVVVGFTGTFGGWHGVDVLAESLPLICSRSPKVHFLLIGDGNYKHLVDKAVSDHNLQQRVAMVGRVPQAEGARLLKACDLYVSPHNSHMIDSKFFGSPTKIFEYMAMGGGIVASDLEQIGETLSPAWRAADLTRPASDLRNERSVLCTPGDVADFVDAVVGLAARPDLWGPLGRNSRAAVEQHYSWTRHVAHLWPFAAGVSQVVQEPAPPVVQRAAPSEEPALRSPQVDTGDAYKDEVQKQWDNDPAGSHYVKEAEKHTLAWFKEAEAYRYDEYAPWMFETMEFGRHAGHKVLEIGGGMGTDLAQFAQHGAVVTDCDLSSGHLELAQENFALRGLKGEFVLHDAEVLPFDDNTFDVVYSNGVLHHTPNTRDVVTEIYRVLKPGGRAIIMMYAENSLHYWRNLVWAIGLKESHLQRYSMGEIMSRAVERSDNASARPLVKVYTKPRLRRLFDGFEVDDIVQRQMVSAEKPRILQRVSTETLWKLMGWNVIIKARKPSNATAGLAAAPAETRQASARR